MSVNLTPPPEREFPAARLEQRKQLLLSRIEADQRRPPQQPLYRRRWPLAAMAATAAAAVAIAATALLTGNRGGPSSAAIVSILRYIQPPPREPKSEPKGRNLTSAVLLRAAHTAAHHPATTPGPGQYVYTKSEAVWEVVQAAPDGPAAIAFQPTTRQIWIGPDGSGRIHEDEGHMLFPTAADAAYFYHAYRNQLNLLNAHTAEDHEASGGLGYIDLSKVPTDPAKLKQRIENRTIPGTGGPPGDAETFQIIGDLLRETSAPPAVRSALYTIVSQLPGVQLIGPTHDQIGRPGIGVAYVSRGLRDELIFDPQTSALLGEQQSVVERSKWNPFPPGSVIGWAAYLASGVVDSTSDTTSATP
ncbi:MAG TPA: CU044_5270 family protein [Gaiellaceae bacterium]|nr:CU044_5270 family protein [Gaiellaceae bacterium]